MKHVKLMVAVLAMSLPFTLAVHAGEVKQDAAPATAGQEMKQDAQQSAKPDAKEEGHDHAAMKVKRFVATVGPDGVQHVEIMGGEYYFDPNYIVVKVNVPVELSVKKAKGYVPHNIEVKAPDAGMDFKVDLSDKAAKSVTFTPSKVGKYEMLCDKKVLWFKSHKDRGMDGFIEVVP
jgi:plastocyanin